MKQYHKKSRVLVVVHPGSACGSADFNLGVSAAALRDAIADEIAGWNGHVHIIDGELSDELQHYARLGLAIDRAKDQAKHSGRVLHRTYACALSDARWAEKAATDFRQIWPGEGHDILLTGAWDQSDGNGCINAMHQILGHRNEVAISERALRLP